MKNLLHLYLFIFILLLSGCKDKEEGNVTPKTTKELIQGKWTITTDRYELYNDANTLIREERDNNKGVFSINGDDIILAFDAFDPDQGTYILTESNDKTYITITDGGITDSYEITKLTQNEMVWSKERSPGYYYLNGSLVEVAKQIWIIELKK